jgi:tetratricopeptide (TPR) repeat protein
VTPEAFDAGARIADILQRQGDGLHAEQQLVETAAAFPGQAGGGRLLLRAARLALDGRRFEPAREHARGVLERYVDSDEAPEALALVADTYHLEGRHAEAARSYEDVANRWPATEAAARALFEAGNCLAEQGDYAHAMARYIESLPQHPDPLAVQHNLERVRKRFSAQRSVETGSKAIAFARGGGRPAE